MLPLQKVMAKQVELANKILNALVEAWEDQNHAKAVWKVVNNEEVIDCNINHPAFA